MVFCPIVAVVMLESRVTRCVHYVEEVVWFKQLPPHTAHFSLPDSPEPQELQQCRKP